MWNTKKRKNSVVQVTVGRINFFAPAKDFTDLDIGDIASDFAFGYDAETVSGIIENLVTGENGQFSNAGGAFSFA